MSAGRAYKAPEGITSISVGGQHFNVVDGIVTVPDDHDDAILRSNGFTPVAVEPAVETKEAVASITDLHKDGE